MNPEREEVIVIKRKQVKRGGPKKIKMPQIDFNFKAIKEVKKNKQGVCKRYSKQSKKERG